MDAIEVSHRAREEEFLGNYIFFSVQSSEVVFFNSYYMCTAVVRVNLFFPVIFPATKTQIFYHMIISKYSLWNKRQMLHNVRVPNWRSLGLKWFDGAAPTVSYSSSVSSGVLLCDMPYGKRQTSRTQPVKASALYLGRNVTSTTFGFELRIDY